MPVRDVVTRRSNHFRSYTPSLKNGRSTPCESILEALFAKFCEISPLVSTYEVQPTRESLTVQGEQTQYTPDFRVFFVNGTVCFFEVKPHERLIVPRVSALMAAAKEHFAKSGRRFLVITDQWLHAEPRASNIEKLMYYRRSVLSPLALDCIRTKLIQHQPKTLSELCDVLGESDAWKLLGQGVVGIDLEEVIHSESPIFLDGGHRHADIFA